MTNRVYTCPRCDWSGYKPDYDGSTPVCPDCREGGTRSLLLSISEAGP